MVDSGSRLRLFSANCGPSALQQNLEERLPGAPYPRKLPAFTSTTRFWYGPRKENFGQLRHSILGGRGDFDLPWPSLW